MAQRLLNTEHIIDAEPEPVSSDEVRKLRQENRQLDEALRNVRNELGQAIADKENLERSIRALRNQLSPLHRFLKALFGEIELAVGEEDQPPVRGAVASAPSGAQAEDPRWQSFKKSFPGVGAEIIDTLLAHPQMTVLQVSSLIKRAYSTTKDTAAKLVKAGAIVRDGTMLRLNR